MEAEDEVLSSLQPDTALLVQDQEVYVDKVHKEDIQTMRKEVAEWLGGILDEKISSSDVLDDLKTGVRLLQAAKVLHRRKLDVERPGNNSGYYDATWHFRRTFQSGKFEHFFLAVSMFAQSKLTPVIVNDFQTSGAQALAKQRDNIAKFLDWCHGILGVPDVVVFETEDLATRGNERQVLNCILNIAKIVYKYGFEPPQSVKDELRLEELRRQKLAEKIRSSQQQNATEGKLNEIKGIPAESNSNWSSSYGSSTEGRSDAALIEKTAKERTESDRRGIMVHEIVSQNVSVEEQHMSKISAGSTEKSVIGEQEKDSNRVSTFSTRELIPGILNKAHESTDTKSYTSHSENEYTALEKNNAWHRLPTALGKGSLPHRSVVRDGDTERLSADQLENEAANERNGDEIMEEPVFAAVNISEEQLAPEYSKEELSLQINDVSLAAGRAARSSASNTFDNSTSRSQRNENNGSTKETVDEQYREKGAAKQAERFKYYCDYQPMESNHQQQTAASDVSSLTQAGYDISSNSSIPDQDMSDSDLGQNALTYKNYGDEVLIDFPPNNGSVPVISKHLNSYVADKTWSSAQSSLPTSTDKSISEVENNHLRTEDTTTARVLPGLTVIPLTATESLQKNSSRSTPTYSSTFREPITIKAQRESFSQSDDPRSPLHYVSLPSNKTTSGSMSQPDASLSDHIARLVDEMGDIYTLPNKPRISTNSNDFLPSTGTTKQEEAFHLESEPKDDRRLNVDGLDRIDRDVVTATSSSSGYVNPAMNPEVVLNPTTLRDTTIKDSAPDSNFHKNDVVPKRQGSTRSSIIQAASRYRVPITVISILLLLAIAALAAMAIVFPLT